MHWELIHEEKADGFDIRFYAAPEDMHPRQTFDDTCHDVDQICIDIDRGRFVWFIAKVTASKAGIELAADYLGGCLYESCQQFVSDNDYYADMCATVIADANTKIRELAGA